MEGWTAVEEEAVALDRVTDELAPSPALGGEVPDTRGWPCSRHQGGKNLEGQSSRLVDPEESDTKHVLTSSRSQ